MPDFAKVFDSTLERDMYSKALVEKDLAKAKDYLIRRKQIQEAKNQKTDEINSVADRLDNLESQMSDIKDMLQQLLKLKGI